MTTDAKRLAEQILDDYGERAIGDRSLIAEWLQDHGLPHAEGDVTEFDRYMRWLWDE